MLKVYAPDARYILMFRKLRVETMTVALFVGALAATFGLTALTAHATQRTSWACSKRRCLTGPTTTTTSFRPTSSTSSAPIAAPTTTSTSTTAPALPTAPTPSANAYTVPASIPGNCSVDVTAALNSWIASVPDGTSGAPNVLSFASNGCYAVGAVGGLNTNQHHDLIFEGNGSTFRVASAVNSASLGFGNDTNIAVQNLHVVGQNTISGIAAAEPAYLVSITYQASQFGASCSDGTGTTPANCAESGLSFDHVNGLTVNNVTTDGTWGDGITIGGEHDYADLTSNVTLNNVSVDRNGRQGIEVGTVNGVVINHTQVLHSWGSCIDLEIDSSDGTTNNVEIENSYFVCRNAAITPSNTSSVNGLFIHNNEFKFFNPGLQWVLEVLGTPGQNWRVDNNLVDMNMGEVPGLAFSNVKGIEVVGNISPEGAPPTARQGETLAAVSLSNDSGTISVTGNTFLGDTVAYVADSATAAAATITSCGNMFTLGVAPTVC
jgi:hypothetical protein